MKWGTAFRCMVQKRITINKINLTFGFCVVLFIFSEYKTQVEAIDSFFAIVERYKIKYIFALLCCTYYITRTGLKKRGLFYKETQYYLANVAILSIISFVLQCVNGFKGDLFNETMYFITPIVFACSLINAKDGRIEKSIDTVFYVTVVIFIVAFRQYFNLSSVLSINFVKSYSPFEGGPAFIAVILTMYYRSRKDWVKMCIAAIVCLLSFKRMTFIFCIIIILFYDQILKIKWNEKKIIWIGIFTVLPIAIQLMCNDSFGASFYSNTGMDFNLFVKGRFNTINLVVDSEEIKYGLGSCRLYLTRYYQNYYNTSSMYDTHCDILRFYLECGIVGTISIAYCYFSSAAKSREATFMFLYIFIESCVNHIFGVGNTLYWILVYLVVFYFNSLSINYNEQIREIRNEKPPKK